MAAWRVRVTCSCPTTSSNRFGRSRRASTWYVMRGGPPRDARRWRLGCPAAQRGSRYRCFLPDLTGFATLSCAGPNHHRPAPRGGLITLAGLPGGRKGGRRQTSGHGGDISCMGVAPPAPPPAGPGANELVSFDPNLPGATIRDGNYATGDRNGVFAVYGAVNPSNISWSTGFRCAN